MEVTNITQQFKKLKVDKKFTPVCIDEGDEFFPNGIFVFNITKMLNYIKQNPDDITIEEVDTCNFYSEFSTINEEHMASVELSQPVILARISPSSYTLIDGNHRMEKARRLGLKKMLAYKLEPEQHIRFLTTRNAYEIYVEYWNGKLKQFNKQFVYNRNV